MPMINHAAAFLVRRVLAEDEAGLHTSDEEYHYAEHGEDHHSEFGVHITYEDLYASIIFFAAIYLAGAFCSRFLLMPALVGEIVAGIIFGPSLLDFVPNAEAFVMLGEIGLILLVIEAGIDVDLNTLKLVGIRGVAIAIMGSILPIGIGIGIAFAIGTDVKGSIAAGSSFGPTSLGIAMNILRTAKIINTPVGQMIVAAAIIDDMIALVILSQLRSLTGEFGVAGTIVPIVSALAFLLIGGFIAIKVLPVFLDRFVFEKISYHNKGAASLAIMLLLLLVLMPATFYAKASFLMGAFISGLAFCSNNEAHVVFVSQFKRIMQWLIRIFFAASIGFQVPVTKFGNGKVLWQGALFTVALLGKLALGLMVPNFTHSSRFTGLHLRDCLVVGLSMMAEGEFAFVIAVFAVDSGLIEVDLYSSIVLAVLFSTIIAPLLLRLTINKFRKQTEHQIKEAEELEMARNMNIENQSEDIEEQLVEGILNRTTVFLCIQTQSSSSWGLLPKLMQTMFRLNLEIIDHRSWHPRGVNTTLVNEVYVQDAISAKSGHAEEALQQRLDNVKTEIVAAIGQPNAKVNVQRWFPGVIDEIVQEYADESPSTRRGKPELRHRVSNLLAHEASMKLEEKRDRQMSCTIQKTPQQILDESKPTISTRRGRRQKTFSTPAVGSDMFAPSRPTTPATGDWEPDNDLMIGSAQSAEVTINGETFKVKLDARAISRILKGVEDSKINEEVLLGASDIGHLPAIRESDDEDIVLGKLQGFVRRPLVE